jgi:hypothetical protein
LAEAVIQALPRFLVKEGVVAMGELGYDEQTPLEDKALRTQIELAKEFELPIMIHTPLRDKRPGTLRTMDVLKEHGFDPARCVIDHNNEETIRGVRDRGFWCAFSIYPNTKMGSERMAAVVESYGPERLIVDSACDWGVSDPLAVAKTARLMAQRGVSVTELSRFDVSLGGEPQLLMCTDKRDYVMRGNVRYWWNGGGDDNVHSSVIAPAPHGLSAAFSLRMKAYTRPAKNTTKPTAETYAPTDET